MNRPLDNLGAYQLLRPLGAGGMAETFVAVRHGPAGFEQRVCLKRILPGCAADPMFVELFLDEARLLARLQCRNIVHVYDFGETDGTYYMALELVDGVDLEGLLKALRTRDVRMAPNVALYIIGEVLAALSYAHSLEIDGEAQHIVHRDISPSNILVSKNGEVKLTDFGIAKARGRSHRTQTGHTKGKVAYMSPEQMRAEAVDGRSDLFAIGVVLFELLTGTHPFDANTDFALQLNIMNGKRPPLRELLPSAPARVAQLVDALLATDAAQRPANAADAIALIPPLDSAFSLQRELQQLVAACSTGGAAPLATGTPSRPVSAGGLGYSPTLSAPAPAQENERAVAARHTTTSKPRTPLLRPIVWLTLAALVLALGYALGRGNKAEAPSAARPSSGPPPTALPTPRATPPVLPAAPLPAAALPRAPAAPIAAPVSDERAREDDAVVAGKAIPSDAAPLGSRERKRAERRKNRSGSASSSAHAASAPSRPEDDTDETPEKSTFVSATRQAPVESASTALERTPSATAAQPRPGTDARAIIQAPRSDESPKEASPRKAYVTPSGRVVIPAPPL